MDKWELKPLVSIGKIKFGMKREDVHKLFIETCKAFKKTKFSKNTTDDYGKFHVFYDVEDNVEAVEIFENIEIVFEGRRIFPEYIENVKNRFMGMEQDGDDYIDIKLSIGISAPSGKIESIIVGNKGYYE